MIIGRRTYDVTNGWEGNYPMRVPCFVVTHNVPTDVPDGPTQFTYVTDGIESAVRQAKAVAGEKDVSIMGGASIARQALEAKLLDEVEIHLSPVTPVLTVAEERRVDERVERARRAEAEVVLDPTQQPWGYPAAFADPDGHLWQVTPVAADPLFAD